MLQWFTQSRLVWLTLLITRAVSVNTLTVINKKAGINVLFFNHIYRLLLFCPFDPLLSQAAVVESCFLEERQQCASIWLVFSF